MDTKGTCHFSVNEHEVAGHIRTKRNHETAWSFVVLIIKRRGLRVQIEQTKRKLVDNDDHDFDDLCNLCKVRLKIVYMNIMSFLPI